MEHKAVDDVGRANPVIDLEGRLPMRAILASAALTVFFVTPTLADYYIVQEPSTGKSELAGATVADFGAGHAAPTG